MSGNSNFLRYSAYYDLLYADKNYEEEAAYVARTLREERPQTVSILELGSGTGRHGRLLAGMGFDVHGVELSAEMVSHGKHEQAMPLVGSFNCEIGDLRAVRVGRRFDAVISLFHVISYQTSNDDLIAAFRTASEHLCPGGVFLFDVWHGPAVLMQRPSHRTKEAADAFRRVSRSAHPDLDTNCSTVNVVFEMECLDLASGIASRFQEEHLMRYLFPTEIDFLARECGFEVRRSEAFLTSEPASPETWGVAYLLRSSERTDDKGRQP